jgi:hypothetical protein
MSPLWAAQPTWTVWVPVPICVTAVPDTFVPLATASTVVVEGVPWYLNWTAPPNAPAPLAEAAGADAAGAALGVDPAQPTTRSALTRTPRIDRMLIPPTPYEDLVEGMALKSSVLVQESRQPSPEPPIWSR